MITPHKKNIAIINNLNSLPPAASGFSINTPCAWLLYIEAAPNRRYYIVVERNVDTKGKLNYNALT